MRQRPKGQGYSDAMKERERLCANAPKDRATAMLWKNGRGCAPMAERPAEPASFAGKDREDTRQQSIRVCKNKKGCCVSLFLCK